MDNFQLQNLQPYVLLLAGAAILLYALLKKRKVIENGEKVEGIIFELGRKLGYGSTFTPSYVKDAVTVRFVTKKSEWITARYKNDFAFFYTGQYKVGDKIEILYNPNHPNDFIVLTKQSERRTKIFLFLIGLIFMLIGIFQLLKSI